jgi:hypothetical protein
VSAFFPSPARRSCAATDLRIPGGGDERTPISGDRGYASSTKEAAMNNAPTHTAHPAFDAVGDVWELDLTQARDRLIAARAHQRAKDSTSNRTQVAECRARIDAILDMHLDLRRLRCSTTASAGQATAGA